MGIASISEGFTTRLHYYYLLPTTYYQLHPLLTSYLLPLSSYPDTPVTLPSHSVKNIMLF